MSNIPVRIVLHFVTNIDLGSGLKSTQSTIIRSVIRETMFKEKNRNSSLDDGENDASLQSPIHTAATWHITIETSLFKDFFLNLNGPTIHLHRRHRLLCAEDNGRQEKTHIQMHQILLPWASLRHFLTSFSTKKNEHDVVEQVVSEFVEEPTPQPESFTQAAMDILKSFISSSKTNLNSNAEAITRGIDVEQPIEDIPVVDSTIEELVDEIPENSIHEQTENPAYEQIENLVKGPTKNRVVDLTDGPQDDSMDTHPEDLMNTRSEDHLNHTSITQFGSEINSLFKEMRALFDIEGLWNTSGDDESNNGDDVPFSKGFFNSLFSENDYFFWDDNSTQEDVFVSMTDASSDNTDALYDQANTNFALESNIDSEASNGPNVDSSPSTLSTNINSESDNDPNLEEGNETIKRDEP